MNTATITSTRGVIMPSWIVIALVGAAIIASVVVASLYGDIAATEVWVGP
jgi:hypothetical protein